MCEIKDYIRSMEDFFIIENCMEFYEEDCECCLCSYGEYGKDLYMSRN